MMRDQSVLIRIVDDDSAFADSQKLLIASLGWEVATYRSAVEFLRDDALERPGCLLLDVRMPAMTGLQLQEELAKRQAKLPIIFLSAHGDIAMAVHTMRHGAVDFLEKPVEPRVLLQRVTTAVAMGIAANNQTEALERISASIERLSARERTIAQLVSEGLRNKEIARKLGIEESTVKMHRANAMAKLGANTSAQLTRIFTIAELMPRLLGAPHATP